MVPTSAVISETGMKKIITVPRASIIEAPRMLSDLAGLIEVTFKGATVLMFVEDIRERTQLIAQEQCAN